MSRAAVPVLKAMLFVIAVVVCGARIRATDLPSCTLDITRCLSACRAVCMRRIAHNDRATQLPERPVAAGANPFSA